MYLSSSPNPQALSMVGAWSVISMAISSKVLQEQLS